MIAIDLGHRFGRLARVGPEGEPEVTTTDLAGVDGVLDPGRALPLLVPSGPVDARALPVDPDHSIALGIPVSGGREDELRYAVERAGLDVARVVPEPVAVALHYRAVAEGVDHTVLVCDQGATTLDLSVLAISPDLTVRLVRAVSLPLGGVHWDEAVATGLAERLPTGVDPMRAAESLRRALDGSDRAVETFEDSAGVRHEVTLHRSDFERAVTPLRNRLFAAVSDQLATAEPAVDTVLMAGGMCAEPRMRAEIEELPAAQGLTVRCDRPELATVLGLLALHDFGILRVVAGPAARPGRAETGFADWRDTYPRVGVGHSEDSSLDTEPGGAATDPEPRAGRRRAEDPEPRGRQKGSPVGRGTEQAPPPPPSAATTGRAPTADTGARPPAAAPYAGPLSPPRTETPPPAPPPAETPPAETRPAEPSYTPPSSADSPHTVSPPTEAATADTTGTASTASTTGSSPGGSDPYDPPATAPAPAGSPLDPQTAFAVPVDQLQAIRRGDHLLVLWAWPAGALSARVRWRREGTLAGAGPGRGDEVCRRRVYEHDGGFDLAVGRGAVTVTVEALVAELGDGCEGASSLLVPPAPTLVSYEPSVRRRLTGRSASVTFTSETGCDLPGVRIVHSLGRFRPTSTAEGTVLHEVPAQRLPAGTPLTVEFPLPATRGPSWLVCFPADADAGTDTGIDIRPTALHRLRVT
ncbi:Hsp70 family protein [Streptomyces sp. NPDC047981]|uniref:Hsp70 family protein n=1 Tax=Streptomyces sp. NPDC047981 TaxID=3154610 RepID=UPI00344573E6